MHITTTKQVDIESGVLLPLSVAEVFGRYGGMVYRLAFSRTKSRADADDVSQEVFMRYFRSAPEFHEEEHRRAWLIRVALRCSSSFMSTAWMRRTVPLDEAVLDTIPEPENADIDECIEVYEAVMSLSAKYRTAVHLFYYEGYSIPQIAEICTLSEATVKTHLHRAREKLRKKLTIDA